MYVKLTYNRSLKTFREACMAGVLHNLQLLINSNLTKKSV